MSETSTGKIVRFSLDSSNPSEMTAAERARFDAIRDEDIDLSDIPETSGRPGWHPGLHSPEIATIVRGALRRDVLMLDEDVVQLFKTCGDESPQKMNAVLREYAEAHRKSA